MSVSRRASFAAGIAAARRDRRNSNRNNDANEGGEGGGGGANSNTITVVAGTTSINIDNSSKPSKEGSSGGAAAAAAAAAGDGKGVNMSSFAAIAKAATVAANTRKTRIQFEVRPFTRESLEKINIRTSNLIRDYGFLPKRSPNLQDGAQLPAKFEPFPAELLGKPVEELDQYVYEKVRKEKA